MLAGPGSFLIRDLFLGSVIARQTFVTQFVTDVSAALGISVCRVYVIDVSAGVVHHDWHASNCIVTFVLFPGTSQDVVELTRQIQFPHEKIYDGDVTKGLDDLYGLVALKWDMSLRLTMSIGVVGGAQVQGTIDSAVEGEEGLYLNHGSSLFCKALPATNALTKVCDFEVMFRQDVAYAIGTGIDVVQVLFVKPVGLDAVQVSFRLLPTEPLLRNAASAVEDADGNDMSWLGKKIRNLTEQIGDYDSRLYMGDVTVRTDETWGLSGGNSGASSSSSSSSSGRRARTRSLYLPYSFMGSSNVTYDRCKSTGRCPNGWSKYEQHVGTVKQTEQYFGGGEHKEGSAVLVRNYEDWREGTRPVARGVEGGGWQATTTGTKPAGSHFDPFDYVSLGPSVPSRNTTSNNGLVLNADVLAYDVGLVERRIEELETFVDFTSDNLSVARLDAVKRCRRDTKIDMSRTLADYSASVLDEKAKKLVLSNSQCANVPCELLFNTTSLALTGAISATGTLVPSSALPGGVVGGPDVALWSFDSIDLSADVRVVLTGQRAMALTSRSSVFIDSELFVQAGTLGGFPGGYSVGRGADDRLSTVCPAWPETGESNYVVLLAQALRRDWKIESKCNPVVQAAAFTATIAGDVLTVSAMTTGTIAVGHTLSGTNLVKLSTTVTALGTGNGKTGTYTISASHAPNGVSAPTAMTSGNRVPRSDCCAGDVQIAMLTTMHGTANEVKSNNVNGPGSGSVRVYLHTIKTDAAGRDEVQTLTTDCMDGQNLGGGFLLHFNGYTTAMIPFDASPAYVKDAMETALNPASIARLPSIDRGAGIEASHHYAQGGHEVMGTSPPPTNGAASPPFEGEDVAKRSGVGLVTVSRVPGSDMRGGVFTWSITFSSFVGNPGEVDSTPLTATSYLTGLGSSLTIRTVTDGNSIAGNFRLGFLGAATPTMPHDVSASAMRTALLSSFPKLESAAVWRSDPTNNCNDGYCQDGPTKSGGYIWTIMTTTLEGNVSPTSPTNAAFATEGAVEPMTVYANALTDTVCLDRAVGGGLNCPTVVVGDNFSGSRVQVLKYLTAPKPFSLAFGGGGVDTAGLEARATVSLNLVRRTGISSSRNSLEAAEGSWATLRPTT